MHVSYVIYVFVCRNYVCIYVYVCMHVRVCVCMYVCMYVRVCVCVCVQRFRRNPEKSYKAQCKHAPFQSSLEDRQKNEINREAFMNNTGNLYNLINATHECL